MSAFDFHFRINIPLWLERLFLPIILFYRKKRYRSPFRRIKLTRGLYAKVDPQTYESLNQHLWHCTNHGYAARSARMNGRKICVYMHKAVLQLYPDRYTLNAGLLIDHINRDKLDNRRANLRLVTPQQNTINRHGRFFRATSKYKGVYWHKQKNKWYARIKPSNGRQISLGLFTSETAAAKAYDQAAKKHFMFFTVINPQNQRNHRLNQFKIPRIKHRVSSIEHRVSFSLDPKGVLVFNTPL